MGRLLRARHVIPLLVVASVLAGCGSDVADPLGLVQGAPATTTESGAARLALSIEATSPTGEAVTIEGDGLVDFEAERARVSIDLAESGIPEVAEIEAVNDASTVYLRLGEQAAALGVDTEWIAFDLVRLSEEATGVDLDGLAPQATGNDPGQALALLQGAAGEVEEVGEEEVRGEPTTHYRATVDLEQAFEENDAITDGERFRAFIDELGLDEMDVEVWIDDEGRARRATYDQPVPGGEPATITMELFDFDTDEKVELPSDDEVTDVTDQVLSGLDGGETPGG